MRVWLPPLRRPPLVLPLAHKLTRPPCPVALPLLPSRVIIRLSRPRRCGLLINLINIPLAVELILHRAAHKKILRCCLQTRLTNRCSRWAPRRLWLSRRHNSPGSGRPPPQIRSANIIPPCCSHLPTKWRDTAYHQAMAIIPPINQVVFLRNLRKIASPPREKSVGRHPRHS